MQAHSATPIATRSRRKKERKKRTFSRSASPEAPGSAPAVCWGEAMTGSSITGSAHARNRSVRIGGQPRRARRSSAIPDAVATFSESTPAAIGIVASTSAAARASALSPSPSLPRRSAARAGTGRVAPKAATSTASRRVVSAMR